MLLIVTVWDTRSEERRVVHLLTSIRLLQQLEHCPILQKSTPSDAFDEIHQVVLDGISDNMALLVE